MKPRVWIIFLFVLISPHFGYTQDEFTEVRGLPTKEVFDLHVDKKGFLWVGHNLGISRYDGVSFTHFTHPLVSSLSMTDILEDNQGRIWCHNFSGQIFYIEDERMKLLAEYDNTNEPEFPSMVILNNELVVSSFKGLFVCNTATLKGRYVTPRAANVVTKKLALLGNKLVALGFENWFVYDQQTGIKQVNSDIKFSDLEHRGFFLGSNGDKLYLVVNPDGKLFQLINANDQIKVVGTRTFGAFINTLSNDGKNLWVNTKAASYSDVSSIKNYNISDHQIDQHGGHWISTLDKGLFVDTKSNQWKQAYFRLQKNDFIKFLSVCDSYFAAGTNDGEFLVYDKFTRRLVYKYSFPINEGGVQLIKYFGSGRGIVSTLSSTYFFDLNRKEVKFGYKFFIRDATQINEELLCSNPNYLYIIAGENNGPIKDTFWYHEFFPLLKPYKNGNLFLNIRCRSAKYDSSTKTIFASFRGQLHELGKFGFRPILFEGRNINTLSLELINEKLFIASYNGLLIKSGNSFRRLSVEDGLASNVIIGLKVVGDHVWLFEDDGIQVYNLQTTKIMNVPPLTDVVGSDVFDVMEINDLTYLCTRKGVFTLSLRNRQDIKFKSFITSIIVNNKDTVTRSSFNLPHHKNDIKFNLAVPVYHSSSYFKYRLVVEGNNSDWSSTKELERSVRFASLMPGEYTFEAYAVVGGIQEKTPIVVHFTINKPWWKQTWFILLAAAFLIAGFYLLYHLRLQQIIRVEKIRRNISHDLHDEIGSTLSSINIYSELAKKERENEEYIGLIQNNVKEVITKLDDLVWSINPKNDSFSQLISRMQLFAEPLMANSHISYTFDHSQELSNMNLSVEVKRNLYLLFKEIINNVAKHAKAKNCSVRVLYKRSSVMLEVTDDGVGFDESAYKKGRTGLNSLFERTAQMKGKLKIRSAIGNGTNIAVIVPIA